MEIGREIFQRFIDAVFAEMQTGVPTTEVPEEPKLAIWDFPSALICAICYEWIAHTVTNTSLVKKKLSH